MSSFPNKTITRQKTNFITAALKTFALIFRTYKHIHHNLRNLTNFWRQTHSNINPARYMDQTCKAYVVCPLNCPLPRCRRQEVIGALPPLNGCKATNTVRGIRNPGVHLFTCMQPYNHMINTGQPARRPRLRDLRRRVSELVWREDSAGMPTGSTL